MEQKTEKVDPEQLKRAALSVLMGNSPPTELEQAIDGYAEELLEDAGGHHQRHLAHLAKVAGTRQAIINLLLHSLGQVEIAWLEEDGKGRKRTRYQGALKVVRGELDALRLDLVALGLARPADAPQSGIGVQLYLPAIEAADMLPPPPDSEILMPTEEEIAAARHDRLLMARLRDEVRREFLAERATVTEPVSWEQAPTTTEEEILAEEESEPEPARLYVDSLPWED